MAELVGQLRPGQHRQVLRGKEREQRYADQFVSRNEFQWGSQASTDVESLKGQRIINHGRDGRSVHLFVRYRAKAGVSGDTQDFTYCGTIRYLRHEGARPIRFSFRLEHALPEGLWKLWSV